MNSFSSNQGLIDQSRRVEITEKIREQKDESNIINMSTVNSFFSYQGFFKCSE